jgi:hypothetical protein
MSCDTTPDIALGNATAVLRYELLDAAERLAADFADVRAGSVLRCFSRAVREVQLAGVPPDRTAAEAERVARVLLDLRRLRDSGAAASPPANLAPATSPGSPPPAGELGACVGAVPTQVVNDPINVIDHGTEPVADLARCRVDEA